MAKFKRFDELDPGEGTVLSWKRVDGGTQRARGKDAVYDLIKDHRGSFSLEVDGRLECKGTQAVCKGFAQDRENKSAISKSAINKVQQSLLTAGKAPERFPAEATDLNKVRDPDAFWNATIAEINAMAGMRFAPTKVADLVFYLNMAASAWDRRHK